MKENESFDYWKKPYHKWLLLLTVALRVIQLWFEIQDYKYVSSAEIRNKIFNQSGWENYEFHQHFGFAISGFCIVLVLGLFLIGIFANSKKNARISESILLLIVSLTWFLTGFVINVSSQRLEMIIWIVLFIATLSCSVSLFRSNR